MQLIELSRSEDISQVDLGIREFLQTAEDGYCGLRLDIERRDSKRPLRTDVNDAGLDLGDSELVFAAGLDLRPELPLRLYALSILSHEQHTVARRMPDRKPPGCVAIGNVPIYCYFYNVLKEICRTNVEWK
jgi:hypothetical protein